MEVFGHRLQLAPHVFSDEISGGLFFLAVALRNFAGDAVLLLQAGQDDVLLLLLHLAYQLAQSLQVQDCLLLVFEVGCTREVHIGVPASDVGIEC